MPTCLNAVGLLLILGSGCDKEEADSPDAEDGTTFRSAFILLCDSNIDDSGYGLCGELIVSTDTWGGHFFGDIYAEDKGRLEVDEPFVLTHVDLDRIPESPDDNPSYALTLEAEAENFSCSAFVEGTLTGSNNLLFLTGTLDLDFMGQSTVLSVTNPGDAVVQILVVRP